MPKPSGNAAEIKQVYLSMRTEIDRLQSNVNAAVTSMETYRTTTVNMDWRGDAADAVQPILDEIYVDIKELKNTIDAFKETATKGAEEMQQTSAANVKEIERIKA